MYKLLIAALLLAPVVAHANPQQVAEQTCFHLSQFAKASEQLRANGVPYQAQVDNATRLYNDNEVSLQTLKTGYSIINHTYLYPLSNPDVEARRFYNACMETWSAE